MKIATPLVLLTGLVVGCEGVGRPIVGTRPDEDGGTEMGCEVTPSCRPVRDVDPALFVVPEGRRRPSTPLDCDGDLVDDAADNCPGVPNETQLEGDCAGAVDACRRLAEGATDLAGADLRGCRLEAPIALRPGLTFAGADLTCASLRLVAGESAPLQPEALDVRGAVLTAASLELEADAPLAVDASDTTLRDSFVRLAGAARLRAHGSIFDGASLVLEPASDALGDGAPAISVRASSFDRSTLYEGPSVRAGRVRFETSTVRDSTIDAVAVDAIDVTFLGARVAASELVVIGGELTDARIRTGDGAFSACDLTDVVFAECRALRFFGADMEAVDAPTCPPAALRIEESDVTDSRFGGGVSVIGGRLAVSVLGDGPDSTIHTDGAELDVVTLCDPGAGAFHEGELRCVKCDEHAFMDGDAVCVGGARLYERGCPAIELAPFCP